MTDRLLRSPLALAGAMLVSALLGAGLFALILSWVPGIAGPAIRGYLLEHPEVLPEAMERLAGKIRAADGFVFVAGEYNWGMQPGLKNLTDHYLDEWAGRPAGLLSYSAGRLAGARSNSAWRAVRLGLTRCERWVTLRRIPWHFRDLSKSCLSPTSSNS